MIHRVDPMIVDPKNCTTAEIADFCALVRQGEEVQEDGLKGRVKKAAALVFLRTNGELVGVAGLKCPAKSHRDKVFSKAGVPDVAEAFELELGWVFIPKAHRQKGYARVLSAAALSQNDRQATFATTRADNVAMQKTLEHLGFRRLGDSWPSTQTKITRLVLFVAK